MIANVSAATDEAITTVRLSTGLADVLAVHRRGHEPHDPDRGKQRERDQRPPVRPPPERDRQDAAEHRTEEVRDARARAPDPERAPAPLRGKAADRARERRWADEPGPDTHHHPRDDQRADRRHDRAGGRADARTAPARQRQPARVEPVDERAAGQQRERVGEEVGAEDDRGGAARDVQVARHRRQRDRDQRPVELQQRGRGRARGQPPPRLGRNGLAVRARGPAASGAGRAADFRACRRTRASETSRAPPRTIVGAPRDMKRHDATARAARTTSTATSRRSTRC